MTVIAWDGKTLAADKRQSHGSLSATTIKAVRIGNLLVGGAGTAALIFEMHEWIRAGCEPKDFPSGNRDAKECASVLVIHPNGDIRQYENTPHPLVILNSFWAIGSGRDFAMAAMHLGKTAREAAEVACALDSNCGNGIDTLELTT